MARRSRGEVLYARGRYSLARDLKRDGEARSPFLAVFWYDADRRRTRSASTGTADVETGKTWLDAFYLERTTGAAHCPTCGQPRNCALGHLVTDAIANYLTDHASGLPSYGAIAARLDHVVAYIATLPSPAVTCESIDEGWIKRFRTWMEGRPIVSPKGDKRPRSLSTIEGSVAQLSAAIGHAFRRHDTAAPARFKAIPIRDLNQTPAHRSDVAELAAMFRYCVTPAAKDEEERKRRIRERAALHRFLIVSVATLARPDAAHDFGTATSRRQWNGKARILALNPKGRRQTKKYRATVPIAWQAAHHFDAADTKGYYVGVASVRRAWEGMASDVGLAAQGEGGLKLIRRSMAKLLRDRLAKADWPEVSMFLGHTQFDTTSDIYAPFDPHYLGAARAEIEAIIDEIERLAPGAFALPDSNVVTIGKRG